MTRWTRRRFGAAAGAAALAGIAAPSIAAAAARLVIVGGGPAGATVARYLSQVSPKTQVTLVEAESRYHTCFFSNLYLSGLRSFDSLSHGYDALQAKHGVTIVHDTATAIDATARRISLASGGGLDYDRLVVAPGIAFRWSAIEGLDEPASQAMPHAWRGGAQVQLLRRQIEAMDDGGLFLMSIPPDPFRCPPGPYERVSMVACYFKREKPRSKILVLDSKNSFPKQELFQDAWNRLYPGMVEWLPMDFHGGMIGRCRRANVAVASETFTCSVADVIPPHTAGTHRARSGTGRRQGLVPSRSGHFEIEARAWHPRGRRRDQSGRNAQVGLRRQQPGQGLRHGRRRLAGRARSV